MHHETKHVERGTRPLEAAQASALKEWITRDGEAAVVEATGLSRFAVARLAAGLDVHATTRLAARSAMARRAR
jgi:hypothetical protein